MTSPADQAYANQVESERSNHLNEQLLNATSNVGGSGKKNFNYKNLTMNIFKNKKNEASIQPSPLFMTHPTRKIPLVNSPNNQTPTKFQSRKNLVETVFANRDAKSATHSLMSPLMVQIPLRTPTVANTAKQVPLETPATMTEKAASEPGPSMMTSFKETLATVWQNFRNSRQVKALTSVTLENVKNSFNLFTLIVVLLVVTAIVNCVVGKEGQISQPMQGFLLTSVSCALLLNIVAQLYTSRVMMGMFAVWNLGGLCYMAYLFYLSIIGDPRWFEHVGGIHVGFLLLFLSQVESVVFTVQYHRMSRIEAEEEAAQAAIVDTNVIVTKESPHSPSSANSCMTDQSGPQLSVRDSIRSQTCSPYVVMRSE